MSWFTKSLSSSLGRKLIMSLTGLFLITFLVVHMIGNMQLLKLDGGEAFNVYAKFMTTNPLIKTTSYLLYAGIIIHIIYSIILTRLNRSARPVKYAYEKASTNSTWASRNMGLLGSVILVFLVIHMRSFWFEMKFGGSMPMVDYDGVEYKNLYALVVAAFSQWWYTLIYVVSMVFLGYHLSHGFASAFQTLGLNHVKYNSFIKKFGIAFAVIIPLLFAIQPIVIFIWSQSGKIDVSVYEQMIQMAQLGQ
ncbi:MAG: succinate dehydrogenase [Thalassobius sp.]|nr:succinate dehydrogenase [Thalassovita sp.]